MKEVSAPARTIHPEVISLIGERYAITLLEIATDLRTGKIKPENFIMEEVFHSCNILQFKDYEAIGFTKWGIKLYNTCGTPCCIIGHLKFRVNDIYALDKEWVDSDRLYNLFNPNNPSNPEEAADAIENYVYNYAVNPWNRV